MKTNSDYDLSRGNIAREEWMLAYMQDVPSPYRALLPPSYDAAELIEAERAIRRMVERDAKAYLEDPFRAVGPDPCMVDWTNVSGVGQYARGVFAQPLCGMGKAIRRGFENHPAVLAAYEQAMETPEYKLAAERRRLSIAFTDARDALNKASQEHADDAVIAKLASECEAAKRDLLVSRGIDPDAKADDE